MFHKNQTGRVCLPALLFSLLFPLRPPSVFPSCRVKRVVPSGNEEKSDWRAVPVVPPNGTSLQVAGLSPSTEYQFSVLARNEMGTGPFSEIATAWTLGQKEFSFPSAFQTAPNMNEYYFVPNKAVLIGQNCIPRVLI